MAFSKLPVTLNPFWHNLIVGSNNSSMLIVGFPNLCFASKYPLISPGTAKNKDV